MQEEHATAQIRQKRRFDKRTADAKAYLVGGQGPLQVQLDSVTTVIPDRIGQIPDRIFRSHDQMGHQGVDKVYNRIQKRFEWPGLKKACEKWISACLSCQHVKDPRKLRFPLQSIESSGCRSITKRYA